MSRATGALHRMCAWVARQVPAQCAGHGRVEFEHRRSIPKPSQGCLFKLTGRESPVCFGGESMDYRLFGRTGVKVSPLCLGAMNFGGITPEADSIKIIHAALDAGIN